MSLESKENDEIEQSWSFGTISDRTSTEGFPNMRLSEDPLKILYDDIDLCDIDSSGEKCTSSFSEVHSGSLGCHSLDHQSENTKRYRLSGLDSDEKVRQNRYRNREHARNTRLRKKAYIEDLKKKVEDLETSRDWAVQEAHLAASYEANTNTLRVRAIERLLQLCSQGWTVSETEYSDLIDDSFTFLHGGLALNAENNILLAGVPHFLSRLHELHSLSSEVGKNSHKWFSVQGLCPEVREKLEVRFVYEIDDRNYATSTDTLMTTWRARSVNAVKNGAPNDIDMNDGMLKATFTKQNKIKKLHMTFDTALFMDALKDSRINDVSSLNAVHFNSNMQQQYSYSADVKQQSGKHILDEVLDAVADNREASACLRHPTKKHFLRNLRVFPLVSDRSDTANFVGTLQMIDCENPQFNGCHSIVTDSDCYGTQPDERSPNSSLDGTQTSSVHHPNIVRESQKSHQTPNLVDLNPSAVPLTIFNPYCPSMPISQQDFDRNFGFQWNNVNSNFFGLDESSMNNFGSSQYMQFPPQVETKGQNRPANERN